MRVLHAESSEYRVQFGSDSSQIFCGAKSDKVRQLEPKAQIIIYISKVGNTGSSPNWKCNHIPHSYKVWEILDAKSEMDSSRVKQPLLYISCMYFTKP